MGFAGLDRLQRPRPRVPRPGDLLIAAPDMGDPRFRRTLVLLLQHDAEGSAGVVVNRPSTIGVADIDLPEWAAKAVVLSGGPVATDSVLALAPTESVPAALRGPGGPGVCMVDLDAEAAGEPIAALRVFVGYSGWSAGQLLAEIGRDDWHVAAATAADALEGDPTTAWNRVLRRQSDATRLWSTLPASVAAN